ncbi:hypothetical protein ES703_50509 [subsurface metagenome]
MNIEDFPEPMTPVTTISLFRGRPRLSSYSSDKRQDMFPTPFFNTPGLYYALCNFNNEDFLTLLSDKNKNCNIGYRMSNS